MNERNALIDALRGFAIILVIMGHVIAFSAPAGFQDNLLFNIIYAFHMPLFFLISGFLVFGRFNQTTIAWIGKKFMGLVIPYAIFTLVYFYVLGGFNPDRITLLGVISSLFSYTKPDSAWFLPVLFEAFVVLAILINAEKILNKWVYIAFFCLMLIVLPTPGLASIPGAFQVMYYTPFVVIGYCLGRYQDYFLKYSRYAMAGGLFVFPVVFSLRFVNMLNGVNDLIGGASNAVIFLNNAWVWNLLSIYYSYLTALAGILFSYLMILGLSRFRISHLFMACGIFSMELYLTHLVVLYYTAFLHVPLWFGPGIITMLSGTLIVLLISFAISLPLSYNKTISTILFGRWSFKNALNR